MTDNQALIVAGIIWLVIPLALLWVARRRRKPLPPYDPDRFYRP